MAESGHVVNVANLKKARDMATGWGGKYQPSNSQLDREDKRAGHRRRGAA